MFSRLANELRQPFYLSSVRLLSVMRALLDGRFEECERLIRELLSLPSFVVPSPFAAFATVQWCFLRHEQGRLIEIESTLRSDPLQDSTSPPPAIWQTLLNIEQGRDVEACELFERVAADGFHDVPWNLARTLTLALCAEAAAALADVRRSGLLYHLLRPCEGRSGIYHQGLICLGSVSHYLGILASTLAEWKAAARHFEDALEMNRRIGARPLLAHSQREYGVTLLDRHKRRDIPRACELLEQALATYTELRVVHWAAKTQALLDSAGGSRLGLSPQHSVLSPRYRDGLSGRDVEVLRLVTAGKSNQAIANELVISRNTVDRHVTHILTKIHVANRTTSAAYAHRQGPA